MIAQAKAEFPNECCGMLAGRRPTDGQTALVEQRYPLVNALASPIEFFPMRAWRRLTGRCAGRAWKNWRSIITSDLPGGPQPQGFGS